VGEEVTRLKLSLLSKI
ncbi:hypothetical protein D031_0694B, partial [Vibrio parahaemolyticus VP-48]